MHLDWEEQLEKAVAFSKARLAEGDDISIAARKAWADEGFGLMIVKQAVQQVMQIESRDAARIVVKATFGLERKRATSETSSPGLK